MTVQISLTGEEAGQRRRPGTLLHCDECGDTVLRSRRDEHEHDLSGARAAEKVVRERIKDQFDFPIEDIGQTQPYEVVFHYEYRERIVVEASHAAEAKETAEREQNFAKGGELVQTLHTEKRELGETSPPTVDYLEEHGMLEDDHDITQTDVERLIGGEIDDE